MLHCAVQIIEEVKKVIVGKDNIIKKVLMVILAGGHILIEDVPGVGKTTLALAFSKSTGLDCKRIQFTPDTMASDITGFSIFNKHDGTLEFKKGSVFCNLLLADEINRTSSKTQSALLEVMEEGNVTIDGITHELPNPFVCIATQNPIGSAGTQNLPDSQLDRFMVRLSIGYPTLENEIDIIKSRQQTNPLNEVCPVANSDDILNMRHQVQQVFISDDMISYCSRLCSATRNYDSVAQGVSPRAVLSLVQMSKANAYLSGRDYVIPDDSADVFVDTCCHRLILKPQAKIRKETPQSVLLSILSEVKAPPVVSHR